MKKRILNKTKYCIVVLLTLLNFAVVEGSENNTENTFQPVSPDQMPGVLTMISNKTQSNYDKIKTWQGKVDATVTIIYEGDKAESVFKNMTDGIGKTPKKVKKRRESTVEFAANCEIGSFFANKFSRNALRYTDPNSGRALGTKSVVGHNMSIDTTEYKISCLASTKIGDSIVARTAIKEERVSQEECPTCGDDIFDPRSFLLAGRPVWETFPFILQYIQKHGEYSIDGHSLHVEKRVDGTTTEYRIEIPGMVSPGQYLFETMLLSSEKDYNITLLEIRRTDGELFQKRTVDYEVIDGIYLPKRTTKQNFKGEIAALSYERECIFTNLKLNQSIPEETFTYKNLGLENGDKFIDKILNKEYIYQDGELTPTNSSPSSYMLKQTNLTANSKCGRCRKMKWQRIVILASRWLESSQG